MPYAYCKYPETRGSVFGDIPRDPDYESWGRPPEMPISPTHKYLYAPSKGKVAVPRSSLFGEFNTCSESSDSYTSDDCDPNDRPAQKAEVESDHVEGAFPDMEPVDLKCESEEVTARKNLYALEDAWWAIWQGSPTGTKAEKLELDRIFAAELKHARISGVYGAKASVTDIRRKTYNRHQNRKRHFGKQREPKKISADMSKKKKRPRRCRFDRLTGEAISWEEFQIENPGEDMLKKWYSLPRKRRGAQMRWFRNELLSWSDCAQRFGDHYQLPELYRWFRQLQCECVHPKKHGSDSALNSECEHGDMLHSNTNFGVVGGAQKFGNSECESTHQNCNDSWTVDWQEHGDMRQTPHRNEYVGDVKRRRQSYPTPSR